MTTPKPHVVEQQRQLMEQYTQDTEDMKRGGGGLLRDGEINTRRFSQGPKSELILPWWNRQVRFDVRREPTNHRVVVAEVTESVWTAHMWVVGIISAVVVLSMVIFGSLGLGYGVVLLAVFALVGYGLIIFERLVLGSTTVVGDIVVMDTTLWEGVRTLATKALDTVPAAQQAKYRNAVKQAKKDHAARVKQAKKNGELPPEYQGPNEQDYVATGGEPVTMDAILATVRGHLKSDSQENYHRKLWQRYEAQPTLATQVGTGVRDCGCIACEFCSTHDLEPSISGVEAARRHRALGGGATDNDARHQRKVAAAKAAVAKRDERKRQQQAVEEDAERKRKAREHVEKLRGGDSISARITRRAARGGSDKTGDTPGVDDAAQAGEADAATS